MQLAASDSARIRFSCVRQHWKTHQQGIVTCYASVVWKRIQEQIGATQAGKVALRCNARGKYQARGVYALCLRGCSQIDACRRVNGRQPQNTVCAVAQQGHPHRPNIRHDLVGAIEATEHKATFRQAAFGPAGGLAVHLAPGVARAITMRQIEEAFAEIDLLSGRRYKTISHDIVVPWRSERAEIAKPIDLNWCGPQGGNSIARVPGVTVQVEKDMDTVVMDTMRCLFIGICGDVPPVVDRPLDPFAFALESAGP